MNRLEKMLDDLAAYLAIATRRRGAGEIGLSHFSGAEPWMEGTAEIMEGYLPRAGQAWVLTSVSARDVPGFDLSMIVTDRIDPKSLFGIHRNRLVSPGAVRGRVTAIYPFMVETTGAVVFRDGTYTSGDRWYLGSGNGRDWKFIGAAKHPYAQEPDAQALANLKVSLGVYFARDYDWRVQLGYVGHPSVSFATDPVGIAEVFRLRDIPEGASRRAALLNWVRSHWRKRRDPDAPLTHVREHMRGKTSFCWNGLQCTITPSEFDKRRLAEGREQASAP